MRLPIRRVGPVEVPLPSYQTAAAAGLDLHAALDAPLTLNPGDRRLIATGLALAIPEGYEGQVRPRSGLALHHGIGMLNSPGTIDADYRGEVQVLLVNLGQEPFVVQPLARVAQLVIVPIVRVEPEWTLTLEPTARGSAGFGSTGR